MAWLVHGGWKKWKIGAEISDGCIVLPSGCIIFGMTSSRCSTRVRCAQADDTELRNFEGRMLAGKESWRQLLKHSFALLNDLCTVFVAVTRTVLQTWGKY